MLFIHILNKFILDKIPIIPFVVTDKLSIFASSFKQHEQ